MCPRCEWRRVELFVVAMGNLGEVYRSQRCRIKTRQGH